MHTAVHIPTNSPLEFYVSMIWEVIGIKRSKETILPQGTIEIVFNFAERVEGILPGGKVVTAPRCFIQGIFTEAMSSSYNDGHHLLGICVFPFAIEPLLGIKPAELNNNLIDVSLLEPAFDRLWHQLAAAANFDDRVRLLQSVLPALSESACQRSQTLSQLFLTAPADSFQSVDQLAQLICFSPRHLNRLAHELFGLSAEELTLYKKFMEGVKYIHDSNLSLTQVAYAAGFYDQAHYCRVFKSFTGLTPNQYRKQKGHVPFHIIETGS